KINTGVWRLHPTKRKLETVMHGMTNSWGFDYDRHGEMFVINTVIGHLWHVVPGGHVRRMYGVDMNPHSYQLIDQVADHVHWDTGEIWHQVRNGVSDKTSAAGGGHAHIGLMIYQGDNWPDEYQNRVYTLNLHGLRINSDILSRQGASYTAKHGPDLCHITDPWFRGMDLITGHDGTVYIADWSDTGECHDHDGVHRTSGRIYRLAYSKPKLIESFNLSEKSDDELIELHRHPNVWWSRQARRILMERASDPKRSERVRQTADRITSLFDADKSLMLSKDVSVRIRLMATLFAIGQADEKWLIARLSSSNEFERSYALRLLVDGLSEDSPAPKANVMNAIERLAGSDPSGLVQLYLASTLQKLAAKSRWGVAKSLVARSEFADDPVLPLMIWYGIEPVVPKDPKRAVELASLSVIPQVTENIARRLTLELEDDPSHIEELLSQTVSGKVQSSQSVLAGMSLALSGWRKATPPASWSAVVEKFSKTTSEETRRHIQQLQIVFGDGRTVAELHSIVTDSKKDVDLRRQSLKALLAARPENFAVVLNSLLGDRVMVLEALKGLALYEHADTP
ncbi:MAG: dehydrogenase, partial [Planctomycetes bacterium]|nr:dehydrogenase [Planctomycetota bacterium]